MANVNPPKKNQAWSADFPLDDYNNPGNFKTNPTIAAGDFKYTIDNGTLATAELTVSVSPAGSAVVSLSMTATGMNGDKITIIGQDQTSPKEWSDFFLCMLTTA